MSAPIITAPCGATVATLDTPRATDRDILALLDTHEAECAACGALAPGQFIMPTTL